MNFDYSEEQTMLRDSVRRYVQDQYSFEARKAFVAAGGFSLAVWAALAELGVLGLTAPADAGGSEMDSQAAMVVMEELGRGLLMEPVAACALMPLAILKSLNHTALAAGIADGTAPVAVAYLEHAHRYHWHTCSTTSSTTSSTTATAQGAGYVLNGTKGVVAGAAQSPTLIVSAMLAGELALFAVTRDNATLQPYSTQDGSAAAEVILVNAKAELLATAQAATDALQAGVNALIAANAAEAVGLMEALCDMTADYLNTRKQFGTAIGSFQALRHRLVDMRLELELARGMSWKANIALSDAAMPLAEQTAICSAAKIAQSKAMRAVGQGGVQLHGGIAVTQEYAAAHYFKRLTTLEFIGGDRARHLGLLAA